MHHIQGFSLEFSPTCPTFTAHRATRRSVFFCKRCTAQGGVHESGARVACTWLGVRPWCGVVGRGSNDKTIHGPSRTTRPSGAVDPSHLIGPSTDPQEGSFLAAPRPNHPAPPHIKPSFRRSSDVCCGGTPLLRLRLGSWGRTQRGREDLDRLYRDLEVGG